jgi:hypothetical protein
MFSRDPAYLRHLDAHVRPLLEDPTLAPHLRWQVDAFHAVLTLDLEPLRPMLLVLYRRHARGGHPERDPVCMLRAWFLMFICGESSINAWVDRLRSDRFLFLLTGFPVDEEAPAVATFYAFAQRFLDGPPSDDPRWKRRSAAVTGHRFDRSLQEEKQARAFDGEAGPRLLLRALQRIRDTKHLPQTPATRMQHLLLHCGVLPSHRLGLLPAALDFAADGSLFATHASRYAPVVEGTTDRRSYADPEATWGYSASKEEYVFGYRAHCLVAINAKDELPLQITVGQAHEHDAVMAMDGLWTLRNTLESLEGSPLRLDICTADKAYDAHAFHSLLLDLGMRAVIPLKDGAKAPPIDGLTLDDNGRPVCPAGLSARWHGTDKNSGIQTYNCPVKRPGKDGFVAHIHECPNGQLCEPDTKMGPLWNLRTTDTPRFQPAIPRDSPLYTSKYNQRGASERTFSWTKECKGLGKRPYRRMYLMELALTLVAVLRHVTAWLRQQWPDGVPRTVGSCLEALHSALATA